MERFDVAIVGAGPSGSSSAIALAQKGYSVVLLDRAFFPREKLCGDFLNPVNWPIFEKLAVADKLLASKHEKVTAFRISNCADEETTIRFPSQNGRQLFGLGVSRLYLDDLLLRRAEQQGVAVRQGCKVQGIAREGEGWSIFLDGPHMGSRLEAFFLIGADGRNSLVAHRLGLARKSEGSGNYVALQAHLKGVKGLEGEVQIHSFPGGYAGLVGLGEGMANLCFIVEKEKAQEKMSRGVLVERCLYQNRYLGESLRESEITSPVRSAFPVYFSPRRSYGDGYLLVGDAARVTEPVTGEGVYFALKSGILAAETIDLAFRRQDRSAEAFSSYERLCQSSFAFRERVNRLVRALIYRPSLLAPVVRLSAKTSFPLRPLVAWLCGNY